jgi:hypothetical protein
LEDIWNSEPDVISIKMKGSGSQPKKQMEKSSTGKPSKTRKVDQRFEGASYNTLCDTAMTRSVTRSAKKVTPNQTRQKDEEDKVESTPQVAAGSNADSIMGIDSEGASGWRPPTVIADGSDWNTSSMAPAQMENTSSLLKDPSQMQVDNR